MTRTHSRSTVRRSVGFPSVCFLLTTCLVAGIACDDSPETVHPTADGLGGGGTVTVTRDSIPAGLSADALAQWIAKRDAILGASLLLGLGSEDPGPELFGYISHADFDGDGNLVLLDADAQEIRRFDPNGPFIDGFGGPGDGPLELRRASWFTFLPGQRIAVALGETGQVKVFHRSDGAWALEEIVDAGSSALHLCSMGNGRLFVSSLQPESNTIASELGDAVRSFGEGYRHSHSFLRSALSEGFVACISQDPARLVFAFDILPVIRSYVADSGQLTWEARVGGHLQLEVAESVHPETGALGYSRREQADHDRIGTLAATPAGDHILIQYSRVFPERRTIVPQTYLLDASTGAGAFLGDTLPNILSVQDASYIALFAEPHPRLEVRSFRANREGASP